MTDLNSRLADLRRPRLLIRAARFGLSEYRRTPAMRRLFAAAGARTAAQIVSTLLAREAELDSRRRAGDAAYSVARHVEVLIALMAEARLLPAALQAARQTGQDTGQCTDQGTDRHTDQDSGRHTARPTGSAAARPPLSADGAPRRAGAMSGPRPRPDAAPPQPKASGISALRCATNASSASCSPASSVGAS